MACASYDYTQHFGLAAQATDPPGMMLCVPGCPAAIAPCNLNVIPSPCQCTIAASVVTGLHP